MESKRRCAAAHLLFDKPKCLPPGEKSPGGKYFSVSKSLRKRKISLAEFRRRSGEIKLKSRFPGTCASEIALYAPKGSTAFRRKPRTFWGAIPFVNEIPASWKREFFMDAGLYRSPSLLRAVTSPSQPSTKRYSATIQPTEIMANRGRNIIKTPKINPRMLRISVA